MGELTDALSQHARVGIDTSIFIYHLEASERYANVAREVLEALTDGAFAGVTSLRAGYRRRPADALQVATSLTQGATAFLTNDKGLRRVRELQIVLLDDFVAES